MSKIWELIDPCEDEPFSSINLSMFRISINSAYEGLGGNMNISAPSMEEVNTLRKQNKQLLKKIDILERMLDLFKKRSTL